MMDEHFIQLTFISFRRNTKYNILVMLKLQHHEMAPS